MKMADPKSDGVRCEMRMIILRRAPDSSGTVYYQVGISCRSEHGSFSTLAPALFSSPEPARAYGMGLVEHMKKFAEGTGGVPVQDITRDIPEGF